VDNLKNRSKQWCCLTLRQSKFTVFMSITLLLAFDIMHNLFHIDTFIYSYFQTHQIRFLYDFLLFFTKLSSDNFSLIYFFILLFYLVRLKRVDGILFSIIIFFISGSSGIILKFILKSPRPPAEIANLSGYSFPSGHVILAITLSFIIYFTLLSQMGNKRFKNIIFFGLIVYVSLSFLSRIYIGAHYLTDGLGGVVVGCFSLALSCIIISILKKSALYNILSDFMIRYML